ncbi:MAG: hypothetical protein K2X38_20920 [Gemmataceae bacterium]|nr:hypothetical protein [Gemmataceae bacterium]
MNTVCRRVLGLFSLLSIGILAGCGGETTAEVKGVVVHKGTPITGGTLIFSPVQSGKPATAEVQSDGTYTLSTFGKNDGAVLGKHKVAFTPPPQQLTDEQRTNPKYIAPPPKYMGLQPNAAEVEVKSGPNKIDLELVPKN